MARLLQVFNRYLHPGGEEKSVERIYRHATVQHEVERCFFDSREWQGKKAPPTASQALRMFYNPSARSRFLEAVHTHQPQAALFHNIYPVGSPALYHTALQQKLPVIQYLHNYRPFSVSGTLYVGGRLLPQALRGDYWPEIQHGAWQGSRWKTALFSLLLTLLHASRWLDSVSTWVAISEFMRQRMLQAGLPPERVITLLHSWDAMPSAPAAEDAGHYLYLGRLVEEKGIRTLLQAWGLLGAQAPLLLVAGDGPLRSLVEQHAAQLPRVRYLGHISGDDKHRALSQCRALLAPSTWWEPLGLVTYEAYDYAKPVLCAAAGGLTETVQHGHTGWLHEPADAEQLASQVTTCEQLSTEQRLAMGHAGRQWLLAHTSVCQWQQKFHSIVEHALASQRS